MLKIVHFGEDEAEWEGLPLAAPVDLIPVDLGHRSAPAPPPMVSTAQPPAAPEDASLAAVPTVDGPHRLPPLPPANSQIKGKQVVGFAPAPHGRQAPERPAGARGAIGGKLALPPVGGGGKVALLPVSSQPALDGEAQEIDFSEEPASTAALVEAPPANIQAGHSSSLPPAEELPPPKQESWRATSDALLEEIKEQQAAGQLPTYAAINALFAPTPPAPSRQ
jgi:hypothetical protein